MDNSIEKARVGKKYLKISDASIEGYFECIKAIKPLLADFDSSPSTPGFYINISGNSSNRLNVVRLTFFTTNRKETDAIIEYHLRQDKIISLPLEDFEDEKFKEPIECNDMPERFRKFLNTYSHIGLDLLDNLEIISVRRLIAKYRFKDCKTQPLPQNPKLFFKIPFEKYSQFFRNLNEAYSSKELWEDLERVDRNGIWVHFLVNMLLPCDCCPKKDGGGIEYRLMSDIEIKDFLNFINLDLPDNWELQ